MPLHCLLQFSLPLFWDFLHGIKKTLAPWRKSYDKPRQCIKKQTSLCQQMSIEMWELDHKEGWVPKNWCFWTVVLEKTLVSPLDCKEIQPVHPKGNQSWVFIVRTVAKVETPIIWPPDAKNLIIGKDFNSGKERRQEEKRTTEDEMVGWHHQLNGPELG